ncbi:MAG: hypothetical protein LBH28_02650 [Oscillospiraceae bacterium]|jgi:hypothetical protein|nr:hypothetical protein [Oscillospiraceae bacterium]
MNADNLDVGKWVQYALADYNAAVDMVRLHRPVPIEKDVGGIINFVKPFFTEMGHVIGTH